MTAVLACLRMRDPHIHIMQCNNSKNPNLTKDLTEILSCLRNLRFTSLNSGSLPTAQLPSYFFVSEPCIRYSKSYRGNRILLIDKYRFNLKNDHGVRKSWVCNQIGKGCKVTISTYGDEIIRNSGSHNH